jgi:2-keto-4-pentenoate hydratase/2-oxohepta-3-ene-1,7-dioic acid hydratase in catechol pathway
MVTADDIPEPQRLTMTTRLNGETVQQAGIDEMIRPVEQLIAYLSTVTELVPGDVIATGTPSGVGARRTPPLWLKPGDQLEVEIDGIGILRTHVVEEA